jgi:hypothetical protein
LAQGGSDNVSPPVVDCHSEWCIPLGTEISHLEAISRETVLEMAGEIQAGHRKVEVGDAMRPLDRGLAGENDRPLSKRHGGGAVKKRPTIPRR